MIVTWVHRNMLYDRDTRVYTFLNDQGVVEHEFHRDEIQYLSHDEQAGTVTVEIPG
jgi:hypothetical protein